MDAYPADSPVVSPEPRLSPCRGSPVFKESPAGAGLSLHLSSGVGSSNPTCPNFHTRVSLIRTASLSVAGRSHRPAPPRQGWWDDGPGLAMTQTGLGARHDQLTNALPLDSMHTPAVVFSAMSSS